MPMSPCLPAAGMRLRADQREFWMSCRMSCRISWASPPDPGAAHRAAGIVYAARRWREIGTLLGATTRRMMAGTGRTTMSKDSSHPKTTATSRRRLLQAGAALAVSGAALPGRGAAQGAGDPDLARLQGARRILLKGGIVLTLDRQVGDFAKADILIEDGKIREIRPDIAADGAAVIEAGNRILIPGFVDTHSHSYQGLLRSSLPNGLVDPDYNRDVQNNLTLHYSPADVYAGVLTTALGFIDMGTTAIIDLSQISHTPEHSDACIRALQEAGIRAVYGYSRGAGAAAQWPQDIGRLQRTYFSSKDQLLTLALGASLEAKVVQAAREAGVPAVMHFRVNAEPGLALGRAGVLR